MLVDPTFTPPEQRSAILKREDKTIRQRVCRTPDAIYHTSICERSVGCKVTLPFVLNISEKEAMCLESKIHDAMEEILAGYFNEKG